jgi:hypothetical protein
LTHKSVRTLLLTTGALEERVRRRHERLRYAVVSLFATAGAVALGYLLAHALVHRVLHLP